MFSSVPPAETERGQMLPDVDAAQQLKLKERQRFFEEVFQHDVDVYLSSAHLSIRDYKRSELDWLLACVHIHTNNAHFPSRSSSDRQHLVHGGECGHAGPNGADWHIRSGGFRCFLQLCGRWWSSHLSTSWYKLTFYCMYHVCVLFSDTIFLF